MNNSITVEQLAQAMKLGKLGEQIVLKSECAFSLLRFVDATDAAKDEFYIHRKQRDDEANRLYQEILNKEEDGLYIQDIIRGAIGHDDPRIPRNLSK